MISMKFALVNGSKETPSPKKSGHCPFCNAEVISKCGNIKRWHWAHKGKLLCDPWWENETEWHRDWKNKFPERCQEQIQYDEKGEKHIADVKTDEGWVLEFQHSLISSEERISRNIFYKKLVWIVDGTRRKRDKPQFIKLVEENIVIPTAPKIHKVYIDDCTLLKEWSGIQWPVLFDFGEENLWCLIPSNESSWGAVTEVPRSLFIKMHTGNDTLEETFDGYLESLKIIVANYNLKRNAQRVDNSIFPYKYWVYRNRQRIRRRL